MAVLLGLISNVLYLVGVAIAITAISSWLIAFNVINPYNNFVRAVLGTLNKIVEPLCRPFRKILPDFGGVDFSPLAVLMIIWLLRKLIEDAIRSIG